MDCRWATTESIKELNFWSSSFKMKRYFTDRLISILDPEGYHLCIGVVVYSKGKGDSLVDYYRTQWMLKLKDQKSPHMDYMDIDIKEFKKLTLSKPAPSDKFKYKT